jgi:hypothetical protein
VLTLLERGRTVSTDPSPRCDHLSSMLIRSLVAVVTMLLGGAVLPSLAIELERQGDVFWVSGGVSADERDELVMALPDYNLKLLTAAERSGAFLTGVQALVRDADGRTVLETSLEGPWLLARLKPGRYELVASWGGTSQTRSFTVAASGRREILLYWVALDVETVPKDAAK